MAHLLSSGLVPLLWGFCLENKLFLGGPKITHPLHRGFSVLWFPAYPLWWTVQSSGFRGVGDAKKRGLDSNPNFSPEVRLAELVLLSKAGP